MRSSRICVPRSASAEASNRFRNSNSLLVAASRPLVLDEHCPPDHVERCDCEFGFEPRLPGLLEANAIDAGEDVDPPRLAAEHEHLRASSVGVGATFPNPNEMSTSRMRRAFVGDLSTNMSRSSVSRGSPCPATAWPPTSTNRTRWEISALKNSVQSRLRSIFTEPDPPQPFHFRDSLLERHRGHVFSIKRLGLGETIRRS